ncbi:glycerophosphodiester phosphodiesterase [Virgibacillus sp. NKC19-16]|uniref:glycerophosphodiester phosphodiesterase n=1 Tax=Virgibacillus salidurans TaxID=2831673 RepID=UPI001F1E43E1|nr:glycerophosphodiester phosphodiesterase [Virgibacillus sp. NKC19-16]UJL46050.1 glycerophosphodiester phosphodiesterase [Virgibacillus sp. NKC19-16]
MTETKIYGHRGCMGSFPENTLLGFRKAIDQGVDGLEIDVHMTSDGEIVVIHDETLDRTTDGEGYVKNLSLAEIKQYSAGSRFNHFQYYEDAWQLEQVPTLQEVLEAIAPYDIELNIELKTYIIDYAGMEQKVLNLVKKYGNGKKVIYSSFYLPSLLYMKKIDPSVEMAWLLDQQLPRPLDYMQALGLEALHVSGDIVLAAPHLMKDVYKNLRVWTVNSSNELKQHLDLNVKAIITDFPEKAVFFRSERRAFA